MRETRGIHQAITEGCNCAMNDTGSANSSATLTDASGLSFPVVSGQTYKFEFFVFYDAAATTTGARFVINGPTVTWLRYFSRQTLTATSITDNQGLTAYNVPAAANASSLTTGNICVIRGAVLPSANGTVQLRFATEVNSSAITVKAGSWVEFEAY